MDTLERQTQLLDAMRRVMPPLVRLLMDEGIGYQQFIAQLKPVFLEQALAQVQAHGEKETDSAISLRSGIARKDVNAWRQCPQIGKRANKRSIPAEVFARWISDPDYQTPEGLARKLPRTGIKPSFETLARSVNLGIHPLSVLNELIRLDLVALEEGAHGEDMVVLLGTGYIPQRDYAQLLELFVDNLSAHMETATRNLRSEGPPQLEQAAYAGELTEESAARLSQLARELWADMLKTFLAEATRLHTQDRGQGTRLVRLGAYFHDGLSPPPEQASTEHQSNA